LNRLIVYFTQELKECNKNGDIRLIVYFTQELKECNKNGDIQFSTRNMFLGITFIRYTQSRKYGKPNNLEVFVNK